MTWHFETSIGLGSLLSLTAQFKIGRYDASPHYKRRALAVNVIRMILRRFYVIFGGNLTRRPSGIRAAHHFARSLGFVGCAIGFIQTNNHLNAVHIITFGAVGQARHLHRIGGNINQPRLLLDIKMMMHVNIRVEIAARLVNLHLAQQARRLELIERIIDRGLADFQPRCLRFIAQSLSRDMPVAMAKQ